MALEGAVERQGVEVEVDVEGAAGSPSQQPTGLSRCTGYRPCTGAYPLGEDDGARARPGEAVALGTLFQPAQHHAHEDAAHAGAQARVVGQQEAHAVGEGEHPLAHGHARQDVVDQVGGGVGHATGPAGGAESTALAGEGDQLVLAGSQIATSSAGTSGASSSNESGAPFCTQRHTA